MKASVGSNPTLPARKEKAMPKDEEVDTLMLTAIHSMYQRISFDHMAYTVGVGSARGLNATMRREFHDFLKKVGHLSPADPSKK